MLPVGFEAHNLDAASEPYGRHAALAVAGDGASLTLRENSTGLNEDVQLFVAGGKSGLTVRDGLQRERISLALHDDGPRLRLLDENGQTLFQAP
ncbi:MAG TPA: hypothetical protein DCY13_13105 [Verrucomicrobiales bacterium]|nr:hypothetical protein [Verrucomicrobiales bacterium]